MIPYDPNSIEAKWQAYWEEHKTFKVEVDSAKKKYYLLEMFPYPSGRIQFDFKCFMFFPVSLPFGFDGIGVIGDHKSGYPGSNVGVTH